MCIVFLSNETRINACVILLCRFVVGSTDQNVIRILQFSLRSKRNLYFYFFCGASKGFMKALKAFAKLLEIPQRSVKSYIFILIHLPEMLRAGRLTGAGNLLQRRV